MQPLTQSTAAAVVVITEHRRARNLPSPGALDQLSRELVLRLERHLVGDLRLTPPVGVLAPLLGEVQRPPQRDRARLPDCVQRHPDLAVRDLPERARILPLDTRRVLAVLRKPGVIHHPRLDPDLRRDPLGDRLDDQRRLPRAIGQELLHRLIVGLLAQPSDQRLQRFARPVLDQPPQIQPAVAHLHRPVHRLTQHLTRERLQPFPDHRRWVDIALDLRTRNSHNTHHDLPALGANPEEDSPPIARIPTSNLTKH
jgi:hypothetical protein